MPVKPSVLKTIATLRKFLANPPTNSHEEIPFITALDRLRRQAEGLVGDPELLAEVLSFMSDIALYKGRGTQMANSELAQWLAHRVSNASHGFPEMDRPFDSFAAARSEVPAFATVLDGLEQLSERAFECVRGSRSRSRHMSEMRGNAWNSLGDIAEMVVRNPAHYRHALVIAADKRVPPRERFAAIEFIVQYHGAEEASEETGELLRNLESHPPDRSFLVGVMQAQIDFGLNSEFGAMNAVGDWDDREE